MMAFAAILAGALLLGGAVSLYLSTPNQRLLARRPARRAMQAIAGLSLTAALAILLALMGPATAVFTWTIGLMLAWTILPVAIGWRHHRKGTRP